MSVAALAEVASAPSQSDFVAANLAALRGLAPKLATRLAALVPTQSRLIALPDGGFDLELAGRRVYGEDAAGQARQQVGDFLVRPLRHAMAEPNPLALQGSAGDFCNRVTAAMTAQRIGYDPATAAPEGHFLIVFGVGLGCHLAPLIDRTDARVIVLVEPYEECLVHSLAVTDWVGLVDRCQAEGRALHLVAESNPALIAGTIRETIQGSNPGLLDGIYLFPHYTSTLLDQARDQLQRDLYLTVTGLGYFEDELLMTRNAVANLSHDGCRILAREQPLRPEPLFIIGSGPSLAMDLDCIAAHADRAVLMSIGTALRVLRKRGLRPDFHVELENTPENVTIATATAREFDLAGTTLLASLTVRQEIVALFEQAALFFRELVSSTLLFGRQFDRLRPAGPTVANAALLAAVRLGFREIYFFGVDMGSKVAGQFHAADSIYDVGVLPDLSQPADRFAGNLGGSATGEAVLNWSRFMLERVLGLMPDVTAYNCSDGVRIAGTIPKVSRMLALPDRLVDRPALATAVQRRLIDYDNRLLAQAWSLPARLAALDDLAGRLHAVLAAAAAARDPSLDWIYDLFAIVDVEHRGNGIEMSYLVGTLRLVMGCAYWYDRRVGDPAQRQAFRRLVVAEAQGTLDDLVQRLRSFYHEVDATLRQAGRLAA